MEILINVRVDLSNLAKKTDIKNTSSFALISNLASLKTEVDKLGINKLVPVPVDLSKLSDVVKKDVVKKTVDDKLVAKVNSIDTSRFKWLQLDSNPEPVSSSANTQPFGHIWPHCFKN